MAYQVFVQIGGIYQWRIFAYSCYLEVARSRGSQNARPVEQEEELVNRSVIANQDHCCTILRLFEKT